MSNVHHANTVPAPRSRPAARCLRHSVWLAACGDCREAHADLLGGRRAARTSR
ncbi:hypothetical protein ACI79H_16715 [Blastococcus sp. SYSU D01042]